MPDEAATPTSDASQDSGDEHHDSGSKAPALKDKECPYCKQPFTSSSLGRHLDQYLHKKKPDGVHDVDEIRKLRGGITRRTARNNKKDESVHSGRPSPSSQHHQHIPHIHEVAALEDLNSVPPGGVRGQINSMNWQATGVINDPTILNQAALPNTPSLPSHPSHRSASPTTNLKKRSFTTYTNDLNPASLSDTARALELSLREVLDSLRAATKHASVPPSPFTFDIHSQSFPSLTLHLLPLPSTLHQSSPFSTLSTTPISAPGPDQLPALRQKITDAIDMWKWQALRLAQRTTTNIADEADFLSRQASTYTTTALSHLSTAYENYMSHPPEIRDLLWHVELLRAYQAEKEKSAGLEEKMDELQQEASQLQQQVEYLSRCQWPREMALWPPERTTFGKKMAEEVRLINLQRGTGEEVGGKDEEGVDENIKTENINAKGIAEKWDFDKLVNKWKGHVREDRQRRAPYVASTGGGASLNAGGSTAPVNGGNAAYGSVLTPGNQNPYNASAERGTSTYAGFSASQIGTGGPNTGSNAGGMHWLGESNRTATPTGMQRHKTDGEANGINGSGSGSPVVEDGRRRTRSAMAIGDGVRKNVSIISDWGGD